jgi:hypothetical protein
MENNELLTITEMATQYTLSIFGKFYSPFSSVLLEKFDNSKDNIIMIFNI